MTSAVLLLCSGGLDSTTIAYRLHEQGVGIVPIFFDYGQHCVEKEWQTLHQVLPRNGVSEPERINISDIFRGSQSRLIKEPDLWAEHVEDEDSMCRIEPCCSLRPAQHARKRAD